MMIFILGEEKDITTDIVCHWLNYYQSPFIRINKEETSLYELLLLLDHTEQDVFLKKRQGINLQNVHKTWFRRGCFDFKINNLQLDLEAKAISWINQHLKNENDTMVEFLYHILKQNKYINDPLTYNSNKLITLYEAQKMGLLIPSTFISRNSESIKGFLRMKKNCITKNIQDVIFLHFENGDYASHATQKVRAEEVTENKYWYSLFQEEVKKKYELRVFFLNQKFYASAIFSQSNEASTVDYRNVSINSDLPNRVVPFKLPKEIRGKLAKLMKKIKLESGSIDMIVDHNDDYYFLEVNPVGQFDFVSKTCNYYIEKEIAQYLCK